MRARAAVLAVAMAVVVGGCSLFPPDPGDPIDPGGIAQVTVPAGNGFGGGTIYHPTGDGPYGAVAVMPGFLSPQSLIAWWGPALAEDGFVVFTLDSISPWDQPAARGDQLLAALDHLTAQSPVADLVDPDRLAVMGWSMGGGGSLEAAADRPSLKAAIPLAGWNPVTNWSSVTVPTLVVGCEADAIASVAGHSEPFYESLPAATPKAYLEIADGDHFCVNTQDPAIDRTVTAWLERFVDGDTSAGAVLCPPPGPGGSISEYRANCPY